MNTQKSAIKPLPNFAIEGSSEYQASANWRDATHRFHVWFSKRGPKEPGGSAVWGGTWRMDDVIHKNPIEIDLNPRRRSAHRALDITAAAHVNTLAFLQANCTAEKLDAAVKAMMDAEAEKEARQHRERCEKYRAGIAALADNPKTLDIEKIALRPLLGLSDDTIWALRAAFV